MRKKHKMLCVMAVLLCLCARVQDVGASETSEVEESSSRASQHDARPLHIGPGNDIVHLSNGKTLENVLVLRETSHQVQIQVWEGVEPLHISRKLVSQIEHGAGASEHGDNEGSNQAPRVITGAELSATFHAKLTKPISDKRIEFEDNDFIAALKFLGNEADIAVAIDDAVHNISSEERQWSVEIPSGASFDMILQENLLPDFPDLKVQYEYDQIRLGVKE